MSDAQTTERLLASAEKELEQLHQDIQALKDSRDWMISQLTERGGVVKSCDLCPYWGDPAVIDDCSCGQRVCEDCKSKHTH
jgi:hypothetical protein